jgi:hypothetical protein
MREIAHFLRTTNIRTWIVMMLSMIAVYLCLRYQITINLPTGLIGIAIVFPIVFSINAAYRRRENALSSFASIKAHAIALVFAHRDWPPQKQAELERPIGELVNKMFSCMKGYLIHPQHDNDKFRDVYDVFSEISSVNENLRQTDVPATEVSRANQYLKNMMVDFEKMRNILVYRTPHSLRSYSSVFLTTFPIFFAPYFAFLSEEYVSFSGYMVAGLYSLILVSLENIQELLENPYDGIGEDDIQFVAKNTYRHLTDIPN